MNAQIIGKAIKSARESKGITQLQLANDIGVSRSHIANIENAVYESSLKTLLKIVSTLEMGTEFLVVMSQIIYIEEEEKKQPKGV